MLHVPRTPRNTCVYTRHAMFVTATSGVLTRLPPKLSKNRMCVIENKIAGLNGLRSEGVMGWEAVLHSLQHLTLSISVFNSSYTLDSCTVNRDKTKVQQKRGRKWLQIETNYNLIKARLTFVKTCFFFCWILMSFSFKCIYVVTMYPHT